MDVPGQALCLAAGHSGMAQGWGGSPVTASRGPGSWGNPSMPPSSCLSPTPPLRGRRADPEGSPHM